MKWLDFTSVFIYLFIHLFIYLFIYLFFGLRKSFLINNLSKLEKLQRYTQNRLRCDSTQNWHFPQHVFLSYSEQIRS